MYVNICRQCNKIYQARVKSFVCKECLEEDEKHFGSIEEYLKKFPNSNALQISEALNITAYEVLNYMKEGRLNISRGTFSRLPD